MIGPMSLCKICNNCRKTYEGAGLRESPSSRRCAANAMAFESMAPVQRCESFVRIGDGKRLLIDDGGRVGPRR